MTERGQSTPQTRPTKDRSTFVLVMVGTFGLQALTVVTGVIIARLLGVEGRGQTALVFALGVTVSQLTIGGALPNAIAKELAERGVAARDGLRAVARRRAGWLAVPCLASGCIMLFLQRNQDAGDKYGMACAAIVMTLQTITFRILVGSLQGEVGRLGRMAIVGMIPQFLFSIALVTAVIADWRLDVFDVMLAFFLSSFAGLAFGYASLTKPTRLADDALDETELWRVTRRSYVSSVRPLDSVGLSQILVGGLLGTVSLGLFAAAAAVSNLCSIVGNAVSIIALPRVAMTQADPEAQRAVIRRWVSFAALTISIMVIAVEIVLAPTIRLAFGDEFSGAIETARWLVLADGLLGLRKVLIAVLQGQGRAASASWIEFALTPLMALGIVAASVTSHLPLIGATLAAVGALSCIALGLTLRRGPSARGPRPTARHRGDRGSRRTRGVVPADR